MRQIQFRLWLRPRLYWGAYSTLQTSSWWGGGWLPRPKNPTPALGHLGTRASSLQVSHFGPQSSWKIDVPGVHCFFVRARSIIMHFIREINDDDYIHWQRLMWRPYQAVMDVSAAECSHAIRRETQPALDARDLSVLPDTYAHHNTRRMQNYNAKVQRKLNKK